MSSCLQGLLSLKVLPSHIVLPQGQLHPCPPLLPHHPLVLEGPSALIREAKRGTEWVKEGTQSPKEPTAPTSGYVLKEVKQGY